MNYSKLTGGILLIAGTTIGGGILALPVALSEAGFIPSAILLLGCWIMMTLSALLLLEVTLWFPRNSHLISMAGKILGPLGVVVTWVIYLLLLYTLVAAYISGGSDLLQGLLNMVHLNLGASIASVLFTSLLGAIVYGGIRSVDWANRGLMFVKLGTFFLLVLMLLWHVHLPLLTEMGRVHSSSAMIAIISFGFSVMIPSLRNYFHDDVRALRIAIWVGSAIPLIAYLLWIAAVMGVIPREGEDGLIAMLHHGRPVSGMVDHIRDLLAQPLVTAVARIFTSVCLLTSFLGVALCLADFLADGFKVEKKGVANAWVNIGAMAPPLLLVLIKPDIFVPFLGWAGVLSVLLTVVMPLIMVWRGRYLLSLAKKSVYQVPGGKILLIILMIVAVALTLKAVHDLAAIF